jgi:hypothetical protein
VRALGLTAKRSHMTNYITAVAWVLLALLALGALWLLLDRNALRDESTKSPKPYSLSRVQLWWWTLIILSSGLAVFGKSGAFPDLNGTCLALLGISLGTAATGRMVDATQASGANRHQDRWASEGFWSDILSDENGLSVHRFQLVMFNLIFAAVFVMDTLVAGALREFEPLVLTVLGVSAGGYVSIKAMENRAASVIT